MSRKVEIDQLADAVMKELKAYSQEVTDALKEEVKEAGKIAVTEAKELSPVDTGDYKKGWRSKTVYERDDDIRVTVYNKTDYQLTHLLEYGHAIVTGGRNYGRVKAYPYIKRVEENAEKRLEGKVKERLGG